MKLKDLRTKNYFLLWGTGAGEGTFIIERRADRFTTMRETGVEAVERYKVLAATYHRSKQLFDVACASYEYSA